MCYNVYCRQKHSTKMSTADFVGHAAKKNAKTYVVTNNSKIPHPPGNRQSRCRAAPSPTAKGKERKVHMNNKIISAEEKKKLDERVQLIAKSLTVMTDEQAIKLAGIAEGIMIANALSGKSA